MSSFVGKTVLVTGAASGMGRLIVERIAADGGRVVLWDLDAPGLEAFAAELRARGGVADAYHCDVSDRAAISATAERVRAEVGPVDVLVNNAGIVSGKPLLEASDDAIARTFAVNTLALFWTTRAFLPAMIARGSGHVVTIASAGGIVGTARLADYCASKFAAFGFDESLRLELRRLGHRGICTTVVCPFYVRTGMFAGVRTRFAWLLPILEPEYAAERIVRAIRQRRRRLVMPRLVLSIYLARLLPVPAFDAIMAFLGISKSMDEFTGRATSRPA
jgi:NAD(P)-dependent dehydrogenase (short-subunit alcohol dehydrogenase family)